MALDISLFDYELPPGMIAQEGARPRDSSRLFLIDQGGGPRFQHMRLNGIADLMEKGDILVLNRTRVLPVRVDLRKSTGGKAEALLLECSPGGTWEALLGGKRIRTGDILHTRDEGVCVEVLGRIREGRCSVRLMSKGSPLSREDALSWLKENGRMPTPPYIKKELSDPEEYQTVFGDIEGSVAAPTAGLHFTEGLLDELRYRGIRVAYVVLHVGYGTFAPVKTEDVDQHSMEEEYYRVPAAVQELVKEAVDIYRNEGKRTLWAVGTTVMRTLESAFDENGDLISPSGRSSLFIRPPYEFKLPYRGFITNFHLPRSTPLMLVSAFFSREGILNAYEEAKKRGYRFYSLGDSMVVRRGERG